MKWYVADKNYVNYLRSIDPKVQDIDYEGSLKPYIGVVFYIEEYKYYIPISSADKPYKIKKYSNMSNSKDFHKIINSDDGKLLAVLNINNMIPIPDEYLTKLVYAEIDSYRTFSSEEAKRIYIDLLRKELKALNAIKDTIKIKTLKIYNHKQEKPASKLSERCCEFKLLESSIADYKKTKLDS